MQIIFADNNYTITLILAGLDMFESESWHAQLTERFFRRSVLCLSVLFALSAAGQM